MSDIVIMNTGTKQNFTKPIDNEYVADDYYTGALIFQRGYVNGKGTYFAVPSEDPTAEADTLGNNSLRLLSTVHDSGMGLRNQGFSRLVGWIGKNGTQSGTVPTTQIPVYVFK